MRLKRYKKSLLSTKYRIYFSILLFVFLFIGIGYSYISTSLSMVGNITVAKYTVPIIDSYNNRLKNAYLSGTYRGKIKTITLDDSINIPNDAVISWDVSVNQDGGVIAYLKTNNDDNTMYDLYIEGDGELIANEDSSLMFAYLINLDSITGLDILDTSNVTNMSYMFASTGFNSQNFTLDLGYYFDTSNVTDMSYMFDNTGCNNPVFTLDLGGSFDTNKVNNMKYMFYKTGYSSSVFTLDLGDIFDTSNVINMSYMFYNTGASSQYLP